MAAITAGDVQVIVRAKLDQFRSELSKGAEEEGEKAGKGFGTQFSKAVKIGVSALATGAFALVTKNVLDVQNATAKLRAEAGLTAEEADRAGRAINRMAGANLFSVGQIGDVLSKVHTDLGLAGEAADAATQDFLTFARATGQDAAGAVRAFDDILDIFNLDASSAAGIMDQLVASHQKYGGSITDNQRALSTLAPQLQALGQDVDDGIGLLNLFAASGLDASKATFALNSAVQKLKPGQDLNDLIAQIVAIEDPTLRAQEAIKIFGARGGVGLATVLRPGIRGLSDFVILAKDVPTATEDAREAMDSTFGAQAQLLFKKFASTVVETLGAGGPVLTSIAAVASLANTFGLDKAFRALANSAAVRSAAESAGSLIGGRFSLAFKAAALIGIAAIAPDLARAGSDLGLQVNRAIGNPFGDIGRSFQEWRANTDWPLGQRNAPDWASLGGEVRTGLDVALVQPLFELNAKAKEAAEGGGTDAGRAFGGSFKAAVVEDPLETFAGVQAAIATVTAKIADDARLTGERVPAVMAAGMRANRQAPLDAFEELKAALKASMSVTAETARLIGQLTSDELAAGMKDRDPAVRQQARETREAILERLEELKPRAGTLSAEAMDFLAEGMKSKDKAIREASTAIYDAAKSGPDKVKDEAFDWGASFSNAYAAGIRSAAAATRAAGNEISQDLADIFMGHSPPKKGPLRHIDQGGFLIGQTWVDKLAEGIRAGTSRVIDSMQGIAAPAFAAAMPTSAGRGTTAAVGGIGGTTINVGPINYPAPEPASQSVEERLRIAAATGIF